MPTIKMEEGDEDVWTPPPTQVAPPPPPAPPAITPEPERKAPTRKPKFVQTQAPSQFIFRLVKNPHAPVYVEGKGWMEERQRSGQASRLFLKTEDTVNWPFKINTETGKQEPLALDENMEDLKQEGLRWLPRRIRYAFGLNTPFADEQDADGMESLKRENGRNSILDNPANRDALQFVNIEMRVPGNDYVRYQYLRLSNQCQNQHPKAQRYGSSVPEYFLIDFAGEDNKKVSHGQLRAKMYELASTARVDEMMPHAKFLGVPLRLAMTDQDREPEAIREDYRDKALSDPELFERTFSDPKVKITYWVQDLINSGDISIGNMVRGQAHWARTGAFIAMLPPDKNPVEFLSEFALMREGEEFAQQMRAIRLTR